MRRSRGDLLLADPTIFQRGTLIHFAQTLNNPSLFTTMLELQGHSEKLLLTQFGCSFLLYTNLHLLAATFFIARSA